MKSIETKKLIKRFDGVHAVDKLSINIEKGMITGIIGPNGSGKTTLTNLLSGMLPIDGGMVLIGETEFKKIRSTEVATYGITRTFQDVRLFEQMTVIDNVLLTLTERGIFKAIFEKHQDFHIKQAEQVIKRVGLSHKKNGFSSWY